MPSTAAMSDTLSFPAWVDDDQDRVVPREECTLVRIPTLFYDDHVARDLTSGIIVKAGKVMTTVWLDKVCLVDLVGDAEYYASFDDEDYAENRSTCNSAKNTLRALEADTV